MCDHGCVQAVCASAPGKVLLTGGYLVLDRKYSGLVLALSSKFHTSVVPLSQSQRDRLDTLQKQHAGAALAAQHTLAGVTTFPVVVCAPQRVPAPTCYMVSLEPLAAGTGFEVTLRKLSQDEENKFVENSLRYSFMTISHALPAAAFKELCGRGLLVHLRGDYQFYSSRPPATAELTRHASPFGAFVSEEQITAAKLHQVTEQRHKDSKTGLGSSAALTSSLVGALFAHFYLLPTGVHSADTQLWQRVAHNVAQLAHCAAQGKVGSGFDVSTAFFGSQQYRRFSSERLRPALQAEEKHALRSTDVAHLVAPELAPGPSAGAWDNEVTPFGLPEGLQVVLGDVKGGSKTPGMVKKVLRWRASSSDANALWERLDARNLKLEKLLEALGEQLHSASAEPAQALRRCSSVPATQWRRLRLPGMQGTVARLLAEAHECFTDIRGLLREMSRKTGVPIEPDEQSALLDETMQVPGVLFAGVPGAGGYDAIFAVTIGPGVTRRLQTLWHKHDVTLLPVGRDSSHEGRGGMEIRRRVVPVAGGLTSVGLDERQVHDPLGDWLASKL